jgi:hypothetical protein
MKSVTKIENEIRKLPVAEQKIIARHLNEIQVGHTHKAGRAETAEEIPHLPVFETTAAADRVFAAGSAR